MDLVHLLSFASAWNLAVFLWYKLVWIKPYGSWIFDLSKFCAKLSLLRHAELRRIVVLTHSACVCVRMNMKHTKEERHYCISLCDGKYEKGEEIWKWQDTSEGKWYLKLSLQGTNHARKLFNGSLLWRSLEGQTQIHAPLWTQNVILMLLWLVGMLLPKTYNCQWSGKQSPV